MPEIFRRHWYSIALGALLLAGAWLRLREFDLAAFNMDEAIAAIYSIQFVFKGDAPMVGVKTSLHFYNSPLLIYLLAPFFAISTNPLVAQGFVAALGVALIGLGARLGRMAMGRPWGLMLAAFLAFSIIGVDTSRRLWGHSFIPFLSTLVFYHTWLWLAKGRAKSLFIIPCAILWAQQLHFSGSLLWVNVAALWLIFRPRFYPRYFAAGCAVGALPYIPYVIKTGFADFFQIGRIALLGSPSSNRSPITVGESSAQWFGDMGRNDMLGIFRHDFVAGLTLFNAMTLVLMGLTLVILTTYLLAAVRKRKDCTAEKFMLLSLVWLIVPTVAFSMMRVVFVPEYLLPAFPAPFALAVLAFYFLHQSMPRAWPAFIVIIALWGVGQIDYINRMYAALAHADKNVAVQTCLRYRRQAVEHIVADAGGIPSLIIQAGRHTERGLDYSYTYLLWELKGNDSVQFYKAEGSEILYVLHDAKDHLTIERKILGGRQCTQFGPLKVYSFVISEMAQDEMMVYANALKLPMLVHE